MSKEAMKLALEALEISFSKQQWAHLQVKEAIKALEKALVKQEQGEPVACDNCKKLEDELAHLRIKSELWKRDAIVWKSAYDVEVGWREQEQGEPVGEILLTNGDYKEVSWKNGKLPPVGAKLYTTPQQRTWVGLTDKRRVELAVFNGWGQAAVSATLDLAKAIEAELREKNT